MASAPRSAAGPVQPGPLGRALERGALLADRAARPLARRLDDDKMARLGIRNTMRVARGYNGLIRGRRQRMRERAWSERFAELAPATGGSVQPPIRIEDGWALDTSGSLPHLDEMLRAADEVIAERGGAAEVDDRYRAFFRNLISVDDTRRWPAFLDFASSPQLIATIADYLGFVPALSNTLPIGVRMVESGKHLDSLSHLPPRDSQVFHIDPYDHPMVYVIVLVRDCTPQSGPFTFLPASVSSRAAAELGYWSRGCPYRLSDEQIYSVVSRDETMRLLHPRGTVLFIDTSRCFHYGARDGERPRFQTMYGFTSVSRTDFSETYMPTPAYPVDAADPPLRRLVLDRRSEFA